MQPVLTGDEGRLAVCALDRGDFGSLGTLRQLEGAERECKSLDEQAARAGTPHRAFLGPDATEAQVRALAAPRILHMATHGFFLPETKEDEKRQQSAGEEEGMATVSVLGAGQAGKPHVVLKNPMVRSGVALAGAQRTLDAWVRGEVPPPDNDGILTAEEVGGLDLRGTWLVTLSACDTGTGEARAGEGVLGLRRGFIQAGAQNLLMSLWPISDDTTVEIMKDFYAQAQQSGNAPAALCEVQRRWLVKLRQDQAGADDANKRNLHPAQGFESNGGPDTPLKRAVRLAGPFLINSSER